MSEVNYELRRAVAMLDRQHRVYLLQKVEALYANRGMHEACHSCPLQLTCMAERYLGHFCVECCCFHVKELEKRVLCDAVSPECTRRMGFCPTCDSGVPTEIHEGVVLLTPDERDRLHEPFTNLLKNRVKDSLEELADHQAFRELNLGGRSDSTQD